MFQPSDSPCALYLTQPLTPPHCKTVVAYCTSNHTPSIETRRRSGVPICIGNRLCHFYSYDVVENMTHFVLECPYNVIGDEFSSLFENIVWGSLKSFSRLHQQVDICIYLTESTALCQSRASTSLKPSCCTFRPITRLALWTLKSMSIHLNSRAIYVLFGEVITLAHTL